MEKPIWTARSADPFLAVPFSFSILHENLEKKSQNITHRLGLSRTYFSAMDEKPIRKPISAMMLHD
jgi:hypothetical protein